MSNSPYDDEPDPLQSCPVPHCTGEGEFNRFYEVVTCTNRDCMLWDPKNGLQVDVWEDWPRGCRTCGGEIGDQCSTCTCLGEMHARDEEIARLKSELASTEADRDGVLRAMRDRG